MSSITRNDLNSGVLQTWLQRKVLENLWGEMFFYQLGEKPTTPAGYNTVGWAKFTKLTNTAITTGTTSDDGVTPADTAFNATVITATPIQYRVVVSLSDVVLLNTVIPFLKGATQAVGKAMADKIDLVIQTAVHAGTNLLLPPGRAARTNIIAGDKFTAGYFLKAAHFLNNKSCPKIGGFFVAVAHPYVTYDLKADTAAAGWLDSAKYAKPDKIFNGEIGALYGVRVLETGQVQTFTSTVTVYPTLVLGKGAYGVSDFQKLQVFITPRTSSDSDPLAQRVKVGAKAMFAVKRLQEDCMVRIETAATDLG